MTRWSAWRSVLAGAVLGFIEAAGSDAERRRLHGPEPVVRLRDRPRPDRPRGLWFLAPFTGWRGLLNRN